MRTVPSYRAQSPALILLVDDNADGILARRSVLEELGYTIVTARSGSDALHTAEQQSFDLIITDYKMPSMDGLQLIGHLRHMGFVKPIILLSGFSETLGLDENGTGADAVIQKSANEISQLVRSTKRLLTAPKKPASSQAVAAKTAVAKRVWKS